MFSGSLTIRLNICKKKKGEKEKLIIDEDNDNADVVMAFMKGMKICP